MALDCQLGSADDDDDDESSASLKYKPAPLHTWKASRRGSESSHQRVRNDWWNWNVGSYVGVPIASSEEAAEKKKQNFTMKFMMTGVDDESLSLPRGEVN